MKNIVLLILLFTSTSTFAQKALNIGDTPPELNMMSAQGEMINLESYKGKKVYLAFFRYAGCPVCNFRMHELMENYDAFKAQDIEIVAVFESGNETLKQYLTDAQIPFPVVGDEELKLYQDYHVQKSFGKLLGTMFKKEPKKNMKQGKKLFNDNKYKKDGATTRIPAEFLISPTGKIEKVYYGKYVGDHIAINELLGNS